MSSHAMDGVKNAASRRPLIDGVKKKCMELRGDRGIIFLPRKGVFKIPEYPDIMVGEPGQPIPQ